MSTLLIRPAKMEEEFHPNSPKLLAAPIRGRVAVTLLVVLPVVIFLIASSLPRIAQPLWYHHFADQRSLLGIHHFGDVASNLPFAVIGIWGFAFLLRARHDSAARRFSDSREIMPYLFFFAGLVLTAFGSSWYHLAPDNQRLVWDRLPMAITFMSLVAAIIADRIHLRLGLWLLPVLLCVGIGSVVQWNFSEARGQGDLRFYAAVQAYSGAVLMLAFLLPGRYTRDSDLWLVLGFYVLAKVLESLDGQIFSALHVVSGHTLKHLAAAGSGYCVLRMIQKRRVLTHSSSSDLCFNGAQNHV